MCVTGRPRDLGTAGQISVKTLNYLAQTTYQFEAHGSLCDFFCSDFAVFQGKKLTLSIKVQGLS